MLGRSAKNMNRMTKEMIKSMPPNIKHRTDYKYPQPPEKRSEFIEELCMKISNAFQGVKLCDGIGLWQAQGLDDYESLEVCAKYRSKDETEEWSKVSNKTLRCCSSSPSFLDGKGFRFYMPAFMISEIRGSYDFDFYCSLIDFPNNEHSRYALLNPEQRSVVRAYLIFLASDPEEIFYRDDIMHSLDTYWTELSCQKDKN